jgi:hypothetical protein
MHYEHINYISSDYIIAEVKQELKSYFEAGAISEVLIPTYIDQALKKLRVFSLKPEEAVLHFTNYKSELPCDFVLLDRAMMYDHEVEVSGGINSMQGYWYKSLECTNCNDCNPKEESYETITVPGPGPGLLRMPWASRLPKRPWSPLACHPPAMMSSKPP